MLSVWQRGYANAFDYNYWASPVGNPTEPAVGNSRFGIPWLFDVRSSAPNTLHLTYSTPQPFTTAHNGVYSDVPTGEEGTLRVSRRWIYTMSAQSGYTSWIYINQQDGSGTSGLAAGEGFTMKGTGTVAQVGDYHNQLYDFRGRPNDGTITVPVAFTGGVNQETLTGNPYPSALDMREFLLHPSNTSTILGTAYYWDQNRATNTHLIRDYEGGYGVWQPNTGINIHPTYGDLGSYTLPVYEMYDGSGNPLGPTGNFGDPIERRFAPIGQGFMVRGTADGVATFDNTMRRHVGMNPDYSQFRNTGGASLTDAFSGNSIPNLPVNQNALLRFHVEVNDSYARDMVLIFSPETTKGADRGWDSKHPLLVPAGDAYWVLEDETDPYVIQSRPFDEMDVIPLGIRKASGNASYKVKVVESHNFNSNMYLYDLQNNIYQRLDTENNAQINLNGPAANVENRFFIVFRRNIYDEDIPQRIADMNLDVFQNNTLSKLQVSNPDMLDIKSASVYDMRGRLVINQQNIGKVPHYEFSTQGLSSGVYVVMLTTQDNQVLDYKVTIHNKN